MKVYVAGASGDLDTCGHWMARLRKAGHEVAIDWVSNIRDVGDANPRDANHEDRLRWTMQDIEGVENGDVFWLLIPEKASIGCWVEFGIAYVYGRRLIVSGDWRRAIFTSLADERYETHEEAFAALTKEAT